MSALDLCGGDPALDFANTLGGARDGPWDDEWLHTYTDLVAWARHAGVIGEPVARTLLACAAERPGEAGAAHADAITLREWIYAVAAALARGGPASAGELAALEAAHRAALQHASLAPTERYPGAMSVDLEALSAPKSTRSGSAARVAGERERPRPAGDVEHTSPAGKRERSAPAGPKALDWIWEDAADLRRPLWPVAQAAVDLLRSPELARLKQCGHCRWLFLDASRNRSRRWCSMAHCGTDAKVRSLRARRAEARHERAREE
jgi:predicted RNA-binding Zn ribbon-like protein